MRIIAGLAAGTLVAALAGALFVYAGVYDISATEQHTAPVYWVLKTVMRQSIRNHARTVEMPPLADPALVMRGLALYDASCVRCHGAPGVAPQAFALGLRPVPANLANSAREWPPAELFFAIKHGIKLTGMPAWQYRLPDDALWAIVAWLQVLPLESPRQYVADVQVARQSPAANAPIAWPPAYGNGNVERGNELMQQYACITCHEIPGVVGASGPGGPPRTGLAGGGCLGGGVAHTPPYQGRGRRAPQHIAPDGAMPNLGISERDASDMAAYLYTLR